ncbi:DExH-box ATP-dependent RNA helicase DExH18, mitochondrial-like [Carex rostrata]
MKLSQSQWDDITSLFRSFSKSPGAMHRALSLYLPSYAFPSAVGLFRIVFLSKCTTLCAENLLKMAELESESAVHRFLFPNFAVFCLNVLQNDLKIFKKLMETADLTKPHTWYRFAHPMKRKVNEEASDKELEVEHKYNEIRRPVYGKQNDVFKTRHFWLTTSVSRALLNDLLSEEDQKEADEELEGQEGEEGSEGEAGDGEEKKKRNDNFVYIF